MPAADNEVSVTVRLPERTYGKITEAAAHSHRSFDEELDYLVNTSLMNEGSVEEALNKAYQAYLSRRKKEGRGPQTTEELWEQMNRVRQEVADELASAVKG